ncbi:S16 family serine protease [Atopobacter sp. AH10]|uniref:S16 family serine protease n=1 Tax=Atopobacter sp. AH10 TaxID=2315861 RepID=UPI001314C1EC|nr:S16 family serine protease [Atopobacter sp. AH10]
MYLKFTFHIHFTNSEIFKNGPSVGLAVFIKLVYRDKFEEYSALITGELDLEGNIIEIGGISKKYEVYLGNEEFNFFIAPRDNYEIGMTGLYFQHVDEINLRI